MLNDLRIEPAETAAHRPDSVESPGHWRARANVYRLLAAVFIEEPSVEFLAALRAPESMAALAEAGVAFDTDFTQPALPSLADALACEYATLFAASGGFPPVESVRLTGRYQQEPLFAVKQSYARAGFAIEKGRFFVFDDHLGLELTFVAELLERAPRRSGRTTKPASSVWSARSNGSGPCTSASGCAVMRGSSRARPNIRSTGRWGSSSGRSPRRRSGISVFASWTRTRAERSFRRAR